MAQKATESFGSKGLVAMRYLGWEQTYTVKTSNATYKFSKTKRKMFVDKRDVEYLKHEYYDGVTMFEVI